MKQFGFILAFACAFIGAPAAQATPISFTAHLTGPNEAPPNSSPGIGDALIVFDTAAHTLSVDVTFSGLVGTTTASHIHCCTSLPGVGTAIVATETPFFNSFPIGVTSGSYVHVFDMTAATSFNSAFVTAHGNTLALAEEALFEGALSGSAYLNIHTTNVPGGEIRGFLVEVPAPATLSLLSLGLAGLGFSRRRRAS